MNAKNNYFFILLCKFKKYKKKIVKILFMMQDVVLAQNIAFCANFAEFCGILLFAQIILRKIAQILLRKMRNIAQNLFRFMRK